MMKLLQLVTGILLLSVILLALVQPQHAEVRIEHEGMPDYLEIDGTSDAVLVTGHEPIEFNRIDIINTGPVTITDGTTTAVFSGTLIIKTSGGVDHIDIDPVSIFEIDENPQN